MKLNLVQWLFARLLRVAALACICLGLSPFAYAQQAKTYGSPLDTLMSTRLWADVPEAKDFVRETRPPPESLAYQPVTGTDPERPKPRTKAELKDLQDELERAIKQNEETARKKLGVKMPPRPAQTAGGQ
ncbi:MAG TPA: hypothetical protein VLZ74_03105 [Methylocella sp.]|nr:hypothetical protein [Methylocella sp.]